MVVAKKYILAKQVVGTPAKENFAVVEEKLPELKDGEYLSEAVYLSVDPYMRMILKNFKLGETMKGTQVAKIIKSKSTKFPVGKYVVGDLGWRTHTIMHEDYKSPWIWDSPMLLAFGDEVSLSLGLGVLGMPGNTAYFGFLEVCKPEPGQTVLVSGAGGAIGSIVGQLAKMKGLTVIGISGSDIKNQWLRSVGFDHVINYKTEDIRKALAEVVPQGIDCYFDNVGGEMSSTVMDFMNPRGKIVVCGGVSSYNRDEPLKATVFHWTMIMKELEMKGFLVRRFLDRWNDGILQLLQWIKEGKLHYKETVTEGFENMVDALVGVLNGENLGKAVVKV